MDTQRSAIEAAFSSLGKAMAANRSLDACLRHWSRFIRLRDEGRCVSCQGSEGINAHHIVRKSFLREAALLTGNGITLCRECHAEHHAGFNGRADLSLPMDAQGGEKIDAAVALYGLLLRDAKSRGIYEDRYYNLSDSVLCKFKLFQGFSPDASFPGRSLEQAFVIWDQAPLGLTTAILDTVLRHTLHLPRRKASPDHLSR